ncbi:MAG TPA: FMN-binding protein [Bacteroidales bacterium]|nr:FMN-binding protein [Bacteroidales bacterium]HRZ75720.1 FMN-binding protein [Bacteroidales bacterium]
MLLAHFPGQALQRQVIWPDGARGRYLERLVSGPDTLGYLLLTSAPGRYERFDYLVLLSPRIEVQEIRVVHYRSDHGYQVASARWLSQFKGYTGSAPWKVGQEVDALSGATISASGLCRDLFEALVQVRSTLERDTVSGG